MAEFMEWCVNGRTAKSGTWTSKGEGKYFAGGAAAGGQMVDLRYLPGIKEGEGATRPWRSTTPSSRCSSSSTASSGASTRGRTRPREATRPSVMRMR